MPWKKVCPARDALILALIYLVVAGSYIVVSGSLALALSSDPQTLHHIERLKGLVFVVVTALLLFLLVRWLLGRYARIQQENLRDREELTWARHRIEQYLVMASICHDSNNVLAALRLALDLLRHDVEEGRLDPGMFAEMGMQCQRLEHMNRRLMEVGKDGLRIHLEPLEIEKEVRDFLVTARYTARLKAVEVLTQELAGKWVKGDALVLHQILLNLVLNAAQSSEGGCRKILIRAVDAGRAIELEVHDDGPGIPDAQIESSFHPFTTTRVEGTGLGLLSVRSGARTMNGSVSAARSNILGGACLRVRLDAAEAPKPGAATAAVAGAGGGR